jgi:hypothetical protein
MMMLYRPVGLRELELIAASDYRVFPARLPHQPIFYPVLNFEYAEQIARDWNAKQDPFAGFVTQFEVDDAYVAKFETHTVGSRTHKELWVPADELDEFNTHIVDNIKIAASYYGDSFDGEVDSVTNLPRSVLSTGT